MTLHNQSTIFKNHKIYPFCFFLKKRIRKRGTYNVIRDVLNATEMYCKGTSWIALPLGFSSALPKCPNLYNA